MTLKDISNIRRFLGVVEGVTISLPLRHAVYDI